MTDDFLPLAAFVEKWGLPSFEERVQVRMTSSMEELDSFYAAMVPHLDRIIKFLDQWPVNEIPAEHKPLAYATLALCEIDNAVNRWRQPRLPRAQDPRTIMFKKTFYDTKVS